MSSLRVASYMLKFSAFLLLVSGFTIAFVFFAKGTTIHVPMVTSTGISYTDKITSYNNIYMGIGVLLSSFTLFSLFLTIAYSADNLDR